MCKSCYTRSTHSADVHDPTRTRHTRYRHPHLGDFCKFAMFQPPTHEEIQLEDVGAMGGSGARSRRRDDSEGGEGGGAAAAGVGDGSLGGSGGVDHTHSDHGASLGASHSDSAHAGGPAGGWGARSLHTDGGSLSYTARMDHSIATFRREHPNWRPDVREDFSQMSASVSFLE
jgi:hypothetical protein